MKQSILQTNSNILMPRQPLWVLTTNKFMKREFKKYGISHFYSFMVDSELYDVAQVIPDGVIDILFKCKGKNPEAVVHGTFLKSCILKEAGIVEKGDIIFGVRFFPGEIKLPNDFPTAELIDCGIDLADIINDDDMIARICDSDNFEDRISIFLNSYIKIYENAINNTKSERVLSEYMFREIIKSKGTIKVEELSDETKFSTRYLNRVFNDKYGLSPKYYAQIIRFQNILDQIQTSGETLTNVAYDTGFFDPAHMNKQFKMFMGMTPKKYRETIEQTKLYNRIIFC